jgi:ubiquinone/menaquinone biosynthesis C-methylase UbiE
MPPDPYQYSAPLYDHVIGTLNITIKPVRMRLAPPNPGMKVLDVGCGTGSDLELYHRAGCKVYGIDLSPAMLAVARKKFGHSAHLFLTDGAQLPFDNRYFDLILSTYTLHEIPPQVRSSVLHEMIRVLKKNGRILLTDFSPGPYYFPLGWINWSIITILEVLAGQEHFLNGRDFLKGSGLTGLIKGLPVNKEHTITISGGAIDFLLVRPA